MKYHIKNKNNKKEMKKARIKPLPLHLMEDPGPFEKYADPETWAENQKRDEKKCD